MRFAYFTLRALLGGSEGDYEFALLIGLLRS